MSLKKNGLIHQLSTIYTQGILQFILRLSLGILWITIVRRVKLLLLIIWSVPLSAAVWQKCLGLLQDEYSAQQFHTWIRPLQAQSEDQRLILLAPNRFVVDWVKKHFFARIEELVKQICGDDIKSVSIEIGTRASEPAPIAVETTLASADIVTPKVSSSKKAVDYKSSHLNKKFVFESFVEGNSNQLARAASMQVAERPGDAYNPLFIYGGVGLGKTHLMHAIGNSILKNNPEAKVLYLHSERFVADMVKALQTTDNNVCATPENWQPGDEVIVPPPATTMAAEARKSEGYNYTDWYFSKRKL